ncbi:hypothetical protein V1514DRAFT_352451 [Lipomyces japonicus]|uniref:uncharacterized protein n=1 Tax=Lipomyces japonicus TaxID=56871 RepID=UPI0034CFC1C5
MNDLPSSPDVFVAHRRDENSKSTWAPSHLHGGISTSRGSTWNSSHHISSSSSPLRHSRSSILTTRGSGSTVNESLARTRSIQSLRNIAQDDLDEESDEDGDPTVTASVSHNLSAHAIINTNAETKDLVWESIEDLKNRVLNLEMADRERRLNHGSTDLTTMSRSTSISALSDARSSPSKNTTSSSISPSIHAHLRAALAQAHNVVSDELFQHLSTSVHDAEVLSMKMPPNDKTVLMKIESLCKSLTALCMVLSNAEEIKISSKQRVALPDVIAGPEADVDPYRSSLSSRLPSRAASRMRTSLDLTHHTRSSSRLTNRSNDETHDSIILNDPASLNRTRTLGGGFGPVVRPLSRLGAPRLGRDNFRSQSVLGNRVPSGGTMSSPPSLVRNRGLF